MTDVPPQQPAGSPAPEDEIDQASQESFPASDPPSWEPLHSGTPKPAPPATPDEAPQPDAP